jgi:hypothetical protein
LPGFRLFEERVAFDEGRVLRFCEDVRLAARSLGGCCAPALEVNELEGAHAPAVQRVDNLPDGSLTPFPERLYQGVSVNTITGAKHTDVRIMGLAVERSGSRLKATGSPTKPSA